MLPRKKGDRRTHGGKIGLPFQARRIARKQRMLRSGTVKAIAIRLFADGARTVEPRRRGGAPERLHVVRQKSAQDFGKFFRRYGRLAVRMRDLRRRMHAGVRSAAQTHARGRTK